MAIAVSSPLFNVAVAAYNAAKFADAVGPLRTTCQVCELLVEDLAALPAADLVQLGKRHRMLAFCLQRSCLLPEAVENAARAAALLALGGDWDSADSALQEAVALRSSLLSKESSEASTQMIKARESISTSTLMQVAGLEQELTSADACLPFLEAELWASLAARHVPVEAVLDVCLRLVAAPAGLLRVARASAKTKTEGCLVLCRCLIANCESAYHRGSKPLYDAKRCQHVPRVGRCAGASSWRKRSSCVHTM